MNHQRSLKDKIMWKIQRSLHNVQLRNFVTAIVKTPLPGAKTGGKINLLTIEKLPSQILREVKENGYSDLGLAVSPEIIERIKSQLTHFPSFDNDKKDRPQVDPRNADATTQLAHFRREDLATISEIASFANDSKILEVTSSYFGVKPTISNINCWWSFGNRKAAKEAQLFHRDLDDFKFLKLFVYLTDVNDQSGPHVYVKGTHTKNGLTDLRRFTDEEVIGTYGESNVITFTKPQGSCFIVDTYGIHKGLLPVDTDRLLLQIQYSLFPLPIESYSVKSKSPLADKDIDSYVNRLLYNN
jgi:hypothetical protein